VLGFSPVEAGLAFLPMTGAVLVGVGLASTRLLPRTGPRSVVAAGMLVAAGGMLLLLTHVAVGSTYAADVLPGLLAVGLGVGLTMSSVIANATLGVRPADAGVASAMVNTGQQVGGSIGTAPLSTLVRLARGRLRLARARAAAHPGGRPRGVRRGRRRSPRTCSARGWRRPRRPTSRRASATW
jgi:hypothetical protein